MPMQIASGSIPVNSACSTFTNRVSCSECMIWFGARSSGERRDNRSGRMPGAIDRIDDDDEIDIPEHVDACRAPSSRHRRPRSLQEVEVDMSTLGDADPDALVGHEGLPMPMIKMRSPRWGARL
jgi:hypothetical protein